MRYFPALVMPVLLLLAACGGDREPSPPPEDTATPAITASPTPGATADQPMPERVTFAPGETVTAEGAGIFFVDPETGATEGWVVPGTAMSFEFWVADITADGSLLVYECQRHGSDGKLRPCGATAPDGPHVWYLFDTESGERRRLEDFTGPFLTLSPDGKVLFGLTDRGPAFQAVEGGETRLVEVSDNPSLTPARAEWSPRGDRLVASLLPGEFRRGVNPEMSLLRLDTPEPVSLLEGGAVVDWSPDGSRVALVPGDFVYDGETPGTLVFDAAGRQLWSSPLGGYPNPRWSPDGSRLAVQVEFKLPPSPEGAIGRLFHLDVFEGETGEPLYRVAGAIACDVQVWTADGSQLIVGGYTSEGSVLVDPARGTLTPIERYVVPTPFDAGLGVAFCGQNFYAVDLDTAEARLLVETTVRPAWDWLHEPLFVGGRIFFTALHGGHGGCAVGAGPDPPPELQIQYPPYGE